MVDSRNKPHKVQDQPEIASPGDDSALDPVHKKGDAQSLTLILMKAKLDEREQALKLAKKQLKDQAKDIAKVQAELDELNRAYDRTRSSLEGSKAEIQRLQELDATLEDLKQKLAYSNKLAQAAAQELDMLRNQKIIRLLDRLFNRTDTYSLIPPPFQQIKDDTLIFNRGLKGFLLRSSINLQRIPFLPYQVFFNRPFLSRILVAPIIDVPISAGYVGIELMSPSKKIIVQETTSAQAITGYQTLQFSFTPVAESDQGSFDLRVFARDIDAPLRLYEWQRYQLFGLGSLDRKAFCGFEFAD